MDKATMVGVAKVGGGFILAFTGIVCGLGAAWSTHADAAAWAYVLGMIGVAGCWLMHSAFRDQGE